ncbi:hypothetical protein FH972_007081 [Carpinus fangiana]|uniref:Knottin scorpion toxin-like domain-containing protein n=1 Tax=Carpinus fangiana TaxID=176857 RepID=A0A5N6QX83_9ROSI|nr:hypothetical protein FH972_007081 [Carpinus fangiana]
MVSCKFATLLFLTIIVWLASMKVGEAMRKVDQICHNKCFNDCTGDSGDNGFVTFVCKEICENECKYPQYLIN